MKDIINVFRRLAIEAGTVLDTTYDCRRAEPYYVEILNLVKAHPEYRVHFVKEFLSILGSGYGPWELIQFCMRELQWDEIRKEIALQKQEEIDGNHDWRIISVLDHILEVYEKDWDDAELYLYYSGGDDSS